MESSTFHFKLFENTPYLDRWENFGLKKCVGVVVIIAWVPLVVLTAMDNPASFLMDVSTYVRFLFALPLLLLSPFFLKIKFRKIVNHFVDADLVKESEREKFYSYIHSTMVLRDSRVAKNIIWIIVYAVMIYYMTKTAPHLTPSWRTMRVGDELVLSLAGRWFTFVSQPVYSFVQLYFIYRMLLWWRFMFLVSKLDLQLRASHGDDTGGLIFLGGSIRLFKLPALALSASIAASAINLVLHEGFAIEELRMTVGIWIAFCFLLFVAPLLLFTAPLIRLKQIAVLSYSRLGGQQLEQFEKKWLYQSKEALGSSLLESEEFCVVTDNISIVNKVCKMRTIPFTSEVLVGFILNIVLPFLPVLALKIPWPEILKKLLNFVV